jgi:hypothetical protein
MEIDLTSVSPSKAVKILSNRRSFLVASIHRAANTFWPGATMCCHFTPTSDPWPCMRRRAPGVGVGALLAALRTRDQGSGTGVEDHRSVEDQIE